MGQPPAHEGAMVYDAGKLIFATVAFVTVAALLALERVDGGTGMGLLGIIVGYVLGNGVAAVRGRVSTMAIGPKPAAGYAATETGPAPVAELLSPPERAHYFRDESGGNSDVG